MVDQGNSGLLQACWRPTDTPSHEADYEDGPMKRVLGQVELVFFVHICSAGGTGMMSSVLTTLPEQSKTFMGCSIEFLICPSRRLLPAPP